MACQCPPGYVSVGNNCVKTTNSAPTTTGTFYTAQKAGPYWEWAKFGANFYADITNLPLPLGGNSSNILDAGSNIVPVTNNVVSTLWGQIPSNIYFGPWYGRANECGLWTNLPSVPNTTNWPGADDYPPLNEWIGFSTCVNVPTTGTYCIGMSADNCLRFKIDGQLIVQLGAVNSGGYVFNFNYWHVFPITLTAGQHIIEMEGLNHELVAFFGAEIYQATPVQLAALTSPAELSAVTIFTTLDKFGQPFNTGQQSGYSCSTGCALNLCGAAPQCVCYDTVANIGCCYLLTNCLTGQVLVTNSAISAYVGMVVTISEQSGCWAVTSAQTCESSVPVTVINSYGSCALCLPCYKLTNCANSEQFFTTNTDLSSYVGQAVQIEGYPDLCFSVSAASNCRNTTPVIVVKNFSNCDICLQKCFVLSDCANVKIPIITNTDLSAYVGQVIQIKSCPGICWTVNASNSCLGAVSVVFEASFSTCELCNPSIAPEPETLRQRSVRPGYTTPGCDPAYTDKVECAFADQIYTIVKKRRYGISTCCDEDLEKWAIKKELLDLRTIYDPTLCVTCAPISCCTSCPVPEVVIPTPIPCPKPTNVTVTIVVSDPCEGEDPTSVTAEIVFNKSSTKGFPPV